MDSDVGKPELPPILILASNPADTVELRLDDELKCLRERLAPRRCSGSLCYHRGARLEELPRLLQDERSVRIVHFSGHGSEAGRLIFGASDDYGEEADPARLEGLFAAVSDRIECVFLNACHSSRQAKAISEHVEWVVGMSSKVKDSVAIEFAAFFYVELAHTQNYEKAFTFALRAIGLTDQSQAEVPRLYRKRSVEASEIKDAPVLRSTSGMSLADLFDTNARLRDVMTEGLEGTSNGADAVASLHTAETIELMTLRYKIGMEHILGTSKDVDHARVLKRSYERAVVERAQALTRARTGDEGALMLNVSRTAYAAVHSALESKRRTVTYWPVGDPDAPGPRNPADRGFPWPENAVDLSTSETGMEIKEAATSIAAQIDARQSRRYRAMGKSRPTAVPPWSEMKPEEALTRAQGELWNANGLSGGALPVFGVARGADQAPIMTLVKLLREKLPSLQIICSVGPSSDVNEINFCTALRDFYEAYEAIDPHPPHQNHG